MEKKERYELLIKQCNAMVVKDIPNVGNLCNLLAYIKEEMNFFWCGVYVMQPKGHLGLGAFSGQAACTIIQVGKGVCGTAYSENKVMNVPDVQEFPGYIACHVETRSEMVVPFILEGKTGFVLDVDSILLNAFDDEDSDGLKGITQILAELV